MQQKRSEIISLLRGQVACPLIADLAELGWLERMCRAPFHAADFPETDLGVARSIFKYFTALGLILELLETPDHYAATDLGQTVFRRYGSFSILNSYEHFFGDISSLLFRSSARKPVVNRMRNILGSGQLHSKKFFPMAFKMLEGRSFPFLVDLGCGNGRFLEQALEQNVTSKIGAIDSSILSVKATAANLTKRYHELGIKTVEADARDIKAWSYELPWHSDAGLFSLWFVLHEFSRNDPQIVIEFLDEMRRCYPTAEILIGELVRVPAEALAGSKAESIMPEFLLFHDLSGQGVLSWEDWAEVRDKMPFKIVSAHHFDCISMPDGERVPSSFIWHLRPI
jgi:SAM-dependent methyltransferase